MREQTFLSARRHVSPQLPGLASALDAAPLLSLLLLVWIISKFLCFPLWLGDRDFPLVPVHDVLLQLPVYVQALFFWISCFLMAFGILFPNRKMLTAILLLEVSSCLLDQNRWQPWQYQFIFMLAVYLFFKNKEHKVTALQIILLGIYFFSGLSKLQPAFIHDIWNNLVLRNWLGIHTTNVWIFRLGYALPLLEMGAALMLCFERFRKAGCILLIGMHVFIWLLLGPLGLNRISVICPWNLLMPVMLMNLFYRRPLQLQKAVLKQPFSWLLITCFAVLPWLHLIGRWDHYLSFTLYSGGVSQLYICTDDPMALQLMAPYIGNQRNGMVPCRFPVSTYQWGVKAMNTPPYPQERVFRSLARQWKRRHPQAAVRFYIYTSGFQPTIRELIP